MQCLCYVQDDVYVRFLELFTKAVATLKVSEKTAGSKCINACKNIYFRRVYQRILKDVTKKGKMLSLQMPIIITSVRRHGSPHCFSGYLHRFSPEPALLETFFEDEILPFLISKNVYY